MMMIIFFGEWIAETSWMFKSTHHARADRAVSVAKISGGVAPWHFTFWSSIKMSENQRQGPIHKEKTRTLQCTVVTVVRSLRNASCRHGSSRSFAQLEHCVRPGGRRGSQQHQLSCTSQVFQQGTLGGARPPCDMPSSAHGSKHEFSCEKSLCTQDKSLNRQHVCSIPFCTHEPSGRGPLKHAQMRTCCGTHCTRESCSALDGTVIFAAALSSSADSKKCTDFTICAHRPLSLITPMQKELPGQEVLRSRAMPRFSTQSASPPALSEPSQEGRVVSG